MMVAPITSSYMTLDKDDHDESDEMYSSQRKIHFLQVFNFDRLFQAMLINFS